MAFVVQIKCQGNVKAWCDCLVSAVFYKLAIGMPIIPLDSIQIFKKSAHLYQIFEDRKLIINSYLITHSVPNMTLPV